MSRVTVAVAGETATVDYTVDALPVLPEVAWLTLNPVSGQHIGVALKKLASEARVVLPAGEYPIVDNADVNNYSVYAPKSLGLRGAGIDKTVIRTKPNSFTYKVSRPKDAGAGLLRYGPNGGSGGKVRTLSDLAFVGAPQAGPDGLPMFSSGLVNYMGRGEVWQRIRVRGIAYGGGNSPNTGETFMVNDYRTIDSTYLDCDFDGRDEAGSMISASPIGFNGSVRPTIKRSYIHHSLYSGLTFSIAGSVATPTIDPTTEDVRIEMNANHPGVGSGGRFSGINHEWVRGQITHIRPSIQLDQASLWDSNHISHGCDQLPDNPVPMFIDNPTWFASPTWANGAFTVKLWGNQSTLPIVRNADGSLKRAVVVAGQSPARRLIDPLTEFAVSVGTGYVAP
ncbi:hypothetical protein [Frigoribacterium sp. RIT-PI-h]|uniref:hypothetical protein n=1 Tax=Frigoribacterium sp. RIT-PI-h TaxID=1690245 RepID=UPI0006B92165|nr:hypothetical protein [Frigoribacterium sp. RIT-PI-h]KPG86526.1 hypothetical protein AEQ27_04230 [Frigoribacterium sp. RIT-PI-h]